MALIVPVVLLAVALAETRITGAGSSLYCDGGILLTCDSVGARAALAALPRTGLTVEFWVRSNGWNQFPIVGLVPELPASSMVNPYGLLWAPLPPPVCASPPRCVRRGVVPLCPPPSSSRGPSPLPLPPTSHSGSRQVCATPSRWPYVFGAAPQSLDGMPPDRFDTAWHHLAITAAPSPAGGAAARFGRRRRQLRRRRRPLGAGGGGVDAGGGRDAADARPPGVPPLRVRTGTRRSLARFVTPHTYAHAQEFRHPVADVADARPSHRSRRRQDPAGRP